MKRTYIVVFATILLSATCFAQKGNNAIAIGGELGIPTSDFGNYFKTGVGMYTKAMYGVGKSGQVTFTSGYTAYKEAGDFNDFTTTISIVPLLFGYRHYFTNFFVEPQLGYAMFGAK